MRARSSTTSITAPRCELSAGWREATERPWVEISSDLHAQVPFRRWVCSMWLRRGRLRLVVGGSLRRGRAAPQLATARPKDPLGNSACCPTRAKPSDWRGSLPEPSCSLDPKGPRYGPSIWNSSRRRDRDYLDRCRRTPTELLGSRSDAAFRPASSASPPRDCRRSRRGEGDLHPTGIGADSDAVSVVSFYTLPDHPAVHWASAHL